VKTRLATQSVIEHMAQGSEQWQAFVNSARNIGGSDSDSIKCGKRLD